MDLLEDVYVINLDEARARMVSAREGLAQLGVERFTRVPGVDGRALSEEQLRRDCTWWCRNLLCSRSMIGCALSHIATWRRIAARKNGNAQAWHLVMEDDTYPKHNTRHALAVLREQLRALDDAPAVVHLVPYVLFDGGDGVAVRDLRVKRKRVWPLLMSTACYLVTTSAAQQLLARFGRVAYHVDIVVFQAYPHVYYVTHNLFRNLGVRPEASFNMPSASVLPMLDTALGVFVSQPARFSMHSTCACIRTRWCLSTYGIALLVAACAAYLTRRTVLGVCLALYVITELGVAGVLALRG